MKQVSWVVWGLCLAALCGLGEVWAAPKPRHAAFVVTRSVEGRTSASVLKRARKRILIAARKRCGKIVARSAGVWRQRCKSKGRRVTCTVKRRFVCGRASKKSMLAKRKARKRRSFGKRTRKAVRRVLRRVAHRLKRRRRSKQARRQSKRRQSKRRGLARRGMCTRVSAVRGLSRSRGKHTAQKQARAAAYRRAAHQCKRRRVVWMAAWTYRCRSMGKGRVSCAAQNKARCCGGRVVAGVGRAKSRKLRRKKKRGRRIARRSTKRSDAGFEP